jgi:nicotinamidase-related amidase
LTEKYPYWPYFYVVEHGGTDITTSIDGPKGNHVGDYVITTRTNHFESQYSAAGLFFSFLGEDLSDPNEIEYLIRDNGKYLLKPTYNILQKYNISELYFSGYGSFGVTQGIKEAQALQYSNITLISDAFHGSMYRERKELTLDEKRNDYFDKLRKKNVRVKTSTDLARDANNLSGRTKTFEIKQPSCIQRNGTPVTKRALVILDLQEGFLSSCTHPDSRDGITVPYSHRLVPRVNAFLEWCLKKKRFFLSDTFHPNRIHP